MDPAINPGANPDAILPTSIRMLPQEADEPLLDQRTNCYLLLTAEGVFVVDPPSRQESRLAAIERAAPAPIRGILVTHTHPDHIGGVPALVARTGATVHAHPAAREHLAEALPFHAIDEGERLAGWEIFATPGHRIDSLTFFDPQSGCALVGDLVAGAGTVVIDPAEGDLQDYLHSLARLTEEIRPTLLAPGHGPLIDRPETLVTHYIEHRMARERLVLQALGDQPASLEALLPRVYVDVDRSLYRLAAKSLLAHLIKLQKEGIAEERKEGWLKR